MAIHFGMASTKIKATYSLDPETVRVLERVSRRLGVSKSEALRRAILSAAELPATEGDERLATLDRLQRVAALDSSAAATWARDVRTRRSAERAGPSRKA